jgi:hypothetical protein
MWANAVRADGTTFGTTKHAKDECLLTELPAELLIKSSGIPKHAAQVFDLNDFPIGNIVVERSCLPADGCYRCLVVD